MSTYKRSVALAFSLDLVARGAAALRAGSLSTATLEWFGVVAVLVAPVLLHLAASQMSHECEVGGRSIPKVARQSVGAATGACLALAFAELFGSGNYILVGIGSTMIMTSLGLVIAAVGAARLTVLNLELRLTGYNENRHTDTG